MEWTRQERQVVLFLVFVALVGLGINFVDKQGSQIRITGYFNSDIGKINLNQVEKEMLLRVPGIGRVLAQRIIDYRQQKKGFNDIAELNNIRGIGESKYNAIKDYFIIE